MADELITGIGSGAGGGVIGVLLGWFGLKSKIDEQKARLDRLEDKVVWRDTCLTEHKNVSETLKRLEGKIDRLVENNENKT